MSDTRTEASEWRERGDLVERRSWLDARVDGRTLRSWIAIGLAIAIATLGFGAWWTYGLGRGDQMAGGGMDGQGMTPEAPRVPPVFAYYDDQPVAFIHTEVSDQDIAEVLTDMMGSPVPVVTSLSRVPDSALGTVYVFANGVVPDDTPAGPLGFQPDVFDSAPGDPAYTPLRRIVEVSWSDEGQARVLTSAEEVTAAEADGDVASKPTDIVVDAPMLTWPGGRR